MATNLFAEAMVELGASSTFNPSELSNATLKCVASHIKTLKRNNIPLTEEALTHNTIHMLDRLIDTKGRPLNHNYKRQIGMTIKRMFRNNIINLSAYNKLRSGTGKSKTRLASAEFVGIVKRLTTKASLIIKETYAADKINDLALYDACLTALITTSTSLRIEEVLQLKLAHIQKIINKEPIGIKSKAYRNVRSVAPNDLLLSVFAAIKAQRSKVNENIAMKRVDKASKYQRARFDAGYLIITSANYMRKKLHELAASVSINYKILGFNIFRKFITSVLVEGGGHFVAQTMNNHSSLNTTLDHYNVIGAQSVQKTYDNLTGIFDGLLKSPHPLPSQAENIAKIKADIQKKVYDDRLQKIAVADTATADTATTIHHAQSLPKVSHKSWVPETPSYDDDDDL